MNMDKYLEGIDKRVKLPFVLDVLAVGKSTLYRGIKSGKYPPPVKEGRSSFWYMSTLQEYLQAKKKESQTNFASSLSVH